MVSEGGIISVAGCCDMSLGVFLAWFGGGLESGLAFCLKRHSACEKCVGRLRRGGGGGLAQLSGRWLKSLTCGLDPSAVVERRIREGLRHQLQLSGNVEQADLARTTRGRNYDRALY